MKIFNFQFSIFKNNDGFTMAELLVAMGLFSFCAAAASGAFIRGLRTQRAVVALIAVNNNASLVLEQMAREMRNGSQFSTASNEIIFTNADNILVKYRLNSDARVIEKSEAGAVFKPITAANVKVNRVNFYLLGQQAGDGYPPRITILINVSPDIPTVKDISTDFQTTVSARELDT